MGLTRAGMGRNALKPHGKSRNVPMKTVALIGNPNVGKSTLFNALTGLRQHTGNWTGKTVENAEGFCTHRGVPYRLIDMPGTYSLSARSPEEQIACDYVCSDRAEAVVVVCDATALERTLLLAVQLIRRAPRAIVCVNLLDEAKKRGIAIDLEALAERLGVPVVGTNARDKKSVRRLMDAVEAVCRKEAAALAQDTPADTEADFARLETVCRDCIHTTPPVRRVLDRETPDRLLAKRWVSLPITAALLLLVFWLTLVGANYPSAWLADGLFRLQTVLQAFFDACYAPAWLSGALLDGVYRTVAWVVSVMLPPMAIFFPLFALMEDAGLLPRIAFSMDRRFAACRACGKQALTICMGFGCNAAGVVGCRIIESKRERLIAVLTNALVPCNGRFPTLISVIFVLFLSLGVSEVHGLWSALVLSLIVLLSVGATLLISWLLGHTLYRGTPSSYVLEIPPFRRPQVGKVLIRSLLDRTLYVLGRAVAVAAPCGLLLWLLANLRPNGQSILSYCTALLDPVARLFGLDGTVLLAFVLGSPANEIVLPIAFMVYRNSAILTEPAGNAALASTFLSNGWTWQTAVCFLIFTVLHWPCTTTLWTIRKETKSFRAMLLAALLPTALGLLVCLAFTLLCRLFGG